MKAEEMSNEFDALWNTFVTEDPNNTALQARWELLGCAGVPLTLSCRKPARALT